MFSKQTKKNMLYKVDYPNAFNLTYQSTKSNINKKKNAKKNTLQQKKSPTLYNTQLIVLLLHIPKKNTQKLFLGLFFAR